MNKSTKCDICKMETDTTYEYFPHDEVCSKCCNEMDREVYLRTRNEDKKEVNHGK